MRVIALTGNMASGKSQVARLLRARGVPVLDLDAMVHALQAPGEPVHAAIVAAFGPAVLASDGSLDRSALRACVVADPARRRALEAITHPAVRAREADILATLAAIGMPLAVVEIPLLFETGTADRYDGILLVDAPEATRLERLMTTRGLSRDAAVGMMATQLPAETKRTAATWIIDNTGDFAALEAAVTAVWDRLTS